MNESPTSRRLARSFWVAGGILALALAVVGMFLPVLPTTPFVLLAAFCFGRGSARFHHWLLHNRRFGPYFRDYREGRGVPLRAKILAITALWLTSGYTALYVIPVWWGKLGLAAIALGVTVHLVRIKTSRPADASSCTAPILSVEEPESD
jgi:uncharacterized membrane protein YbaN (DUF454 family)